MASVLTCPQCRKQLSVSDLIDAESEVRCPLCRHRFMFSTSSATTLSELIVMPPEEPAFKPTAKPAAAVVQKPVAKQPAIEKPTITQPVSDSLASQAASSTFSYNRSEENAPEKSIAPSVSAKPSTELPTKPIEPFSMPKFKAPAPDSVLPKEEPVKPSEFKQPAIDTPATDSPTSFEKQAPKQPVQRDRTSERPKPFAASVASTSASTSDSTIKAKAPENKSVEVEKVKSQTQTLTGGNQRQEKITSPDPLETYNNSQAQTPTGGNQRQEKIALPDALETSSKTPLSTKESPKNTPVEDKKPSLLSKEVAPKDNKTNLPAQETLFKGDKTTAPAKQSPSSTRLSEQFMPRLSDYFDGNETTDQSATASSAAASLSTAASKLSTSGNVPLGDDKDGTSWSWFGRAYDGTSEERLDNPEEKSKGLSSIVPKKKMLVPAAVVGASCLTLFSGYYLLTWAAGSGSESVASPEMANTTPADPSRAMPATFEEPIDTPEKPAVEAVIVEQTPEPIVPEPKASILDRMATSDSEKEDRYGTSTEQPLATNGSPFEKPASVADANPTNNITQPSKESTEEPGRLPIIEAQPLVQQPIVPPPIARESATPQPVQLQNSVQLANLPTVSFNQFQNTFQAANAQRNNFLPGELTDPTALRTKAIAYAKFSELAHHLTFVTEDLLPTEWTTQLEAEKWLKKLAAAPGAASQLSTLAELWMNSPNRTNQGIFFVGTPIKMKRLDGAYYYQFDIGTGKPVAVFMKRKIPAKYFSSKVPIGIVGALIDNLPEKIIGYPGDEPIVIWSRFQFPLLHQQPTSLVEQASAVEEYKSPAREDKPSAVPPPKFNSSVLE